MNGTVSSGSMGGRGSRTLEGSKTQHPGGNGGGPEQQTATAKKAHEYRAPPPIRNCGVGHAAGRGRVAGQVDRTTTATTPARQQQRNNNPHRDPYFSQHPGTGSKYFNC